MTNKLFLAALAALVFSSALIFIAATSPLMPETTAQTSASVEQTDGTETVYTVKAIEGGIGIFADGSDEPVRIIGVDPKSLPQDAQLLLEDGITVNGRSELLLLIEDYVS